MKARVHIAVGILLLVLSLSLLAEPKKLVVAESDHYTTAFVITVAEPQTVRIQDCASFGVRAEVQSSEIVRHVGGKMCYGPFTIADAPNNADVVSVLRFDDGLTRSSFILPAIGAVSDAGPSVVGPLVSDEIDGAFLVVFPEQRTPMHVTLYDGRNLLAPIVEEFVAEPPVTLYRIQAKGIFRGVVALGYDYWRCFPATSCAALGNVYGFASTGTPDGASVRSFPFGE